MLFFSKDLLNELQRRREHTERAQRALIDEVHRLIQEGETVDAELLKRIALPGPPTILKHADPHRLFSSDVIRDTCIRYRLRFLPLCYYKPQLPYEALLQVRKLEQENQTQLQNLYVMAPAEAFKLERKTDPLLFAGLDNGTYLLVHRWGSDLAWYRKVVAWPWRNLQTMLVTMFCLSLMITFALPSSWISFNDQMSRMTYSIRMYIFFMLVLATLFTALFFHVRKNKNLSEDEWDSKYF